MLQKYLHRRGNVYYFRYRLPVDLRPMIGVTELVRSLHTESMFDAFTRSRQLSESVKLIRDARQAYFSNEISAENYVRLVLTECRRAWSMSSKDLGSISKVITIGDATFDFDNDLDKELEAAKKAQDLGLIQRQTNISAQQQSQQLINSSNMLFSELFEEFLAHKIDPKAAILEKRKALGEKAQKEYRRYFDVLIEIISDVSISSIDKKIIKEALMTYKQLPPRNKLPHKNLSVQELLELEIPESETVSNKTVEAVRKVVQGIFRYAIDAGHLSDSPARDLNLKLKTSTFASYTKTEVQKMLDAVDSEAESWKHWILRLAAYTGARRAELVQLRCDDIKYDDESKRYYILITDDAGDIKTYNAKRQVPLHQALVVAGFLDYVEVRRNFGGPLFNGVKPAAVTGWFSRFRDRLGIEKFNDFGERKVFHSFRHSFITISRDSSNSLEAVQQVVGHEKTSAGMTDRYTHRLPLKDVLKVVDCIDYDSYVDMQLRAQQNRG